MIRKLAVIAVVALIPGLAFAAGTSTNAPVSDSATHAVSGDAKTDSSVKTEGVKPGKAVHHRVAHRTKADKTKAGATADGKTDTKL